MVYAGFPLSLNQKGLYVYSTTFLLKPKSVLVAAVAVDVILNVTLSQFTWISITASCFCCTSWKCNVNKVHTWYKSYRTGCCFCLWHESLQSASILLYVTIYNSSSQLSTHIVRTTFHLWMLFMWITQKITLFNRKAKKKYMKYLKKGVPKSKIILPVSLGYNSLIVIILAPWLNPFCAIICPLSVRGHWNKQVPAETMLGKVLSIVHRMVHNHTCSVLHNWSKDWTTMQI